MGDVRDAFNYQGKALLANAVIFGGVLVLLVILLASKIYKATRRNNDITTKHLTRKVSKVVDVMDDYTETRHEHSVL